MSTIPTAAIEPREDAPQTDGSREDAHESAESRADARQLEPTVEVVSRTTDKAPEQLDLLNDSYAQQILTALCSGPQRGRELTDSCDFSRPTVYRRLSRLESAGLVHAELHIDPDGNHCKEFSLARDRLHLTIDNGIITVTARQSTLD